MKLGSSSIVGLALLAITNFAGAHLSANSLNPKGGEMIHVGDESSVTWNVVVLHNAKFDIDFSKDGGSSWMSLKKAFVGVDGDNTFKWSVLPEHVTQMGKIRICQPSTGRACTDADNVSKPITAPYVLVSGAFMVMASTGIVESTPESNSLALNFRSDSRNVEVSFTNSQSQSVLLQAFDTQGRLVANLIDGNYAAGSHQLSVFSNRLDVNAKALVFKLKVGNQVKTQTWNRI